MVEQKSTTPARHPAAREPEQQATIVVPQTNDIFPRPPFDPAAIGYLDLSTGGYDFLPGLPGLIIDTGIKDEISRIPETNIPFGFAVADGATNAGFCKLASATTDHVIGISVLDFTCFLTTIWGTSAFYGYSTNAWSCRVLRVGRIWALPTTAVTRGAPVGFAADGSLSTGGTAIKGAYWASDTPAANQLAAIQINLNQ
jgi:hypothetical protein